MAAAEEGQGGQARCQVCHDKAAKYCCPRCQQRTCSLDCVKAHKEAAGCSGKRDRTAFVGRAAFDERTFMSDYRFLEEVQLAEDVAKRSKPPAPKLDMPQFLQTLVYQARRRGVQLHILPPGMERRRTNSTRYDGRTQTLSWRVEWRFPAADAKTADAKVHDNTPMADLLAAHLALQPGAAARHHALREYSEAGMPALTVVMRKERTPANAVEYHEIDVGRPLRQQLAGKVLVEHPTFTVLLPRERAAYNILPAATPAAASAGTAAAAAGAAVDTGAAATGAAAVADAAAMAASAPADTAAGGAVAATSDGAAAASGNASAVEAPAAGVARAIMAPQSEAAVGGGQQASGAGTSPHVSTAAAAAAIAAGPAL